MLVSPTAQQHSYDTRAQLDTEVRSACGHSTTSALCLHPETGPCSARLSLPGPCTEGFDMPFVRGRAGRDGPRLLPLPVRVRGMHGWG